VLEGGLLIHYEASDLEEQVISALETGVSLIIYIGGDGFNYAVVNGVMRSGVELDNIALLYGSGGTSADFLRYFNGRTPQDVLDAAKSYVEGKTPVNIDIISAAFTTTEGHIIKRSTVYLVGLSFSAEMIKWINQHAEIKKQKGERVYAHALLEKFDDYQTPNFNISIDKISVPGQKNVLLSVHGTPRAGGNLLAARRASPQDGLIDLFVVNNVNKIEVAALLLMAGHGIPIDWYPKVHYYQGQIIEVIPENPINQVQFDGDLHIIPSGIARIRFSVTGQVPFVVRGSI